MEFVITLLEKSTVLFSHFFIIQSGINLFIVVASFQTIQAHQEIN